MNKPNYLAVWIYLLMSANHEETKVIWNRKNTVIKKGSFIGSLRKISEHFGISIATVKYIVDYFVSEQMIEHSATKKFSVFTILNWSKYQGIEHQIEHKVKSKLNQSETNKNDKNEKNDNNKSSSEDGAEVNSLISLFKEVNPDYQKFYKIKGHREAVSFIISKFGADKSANLIRYLPQLNSMPYAPTVTNPIQLRSKLGDIKAFMEKERNKQESKFKVII